MVAGLFYCGWLLSCFILATNTVAHFFFHNGIKSSMRPIIVALMSNRSSPLNQARREGKFACLQVCY
jgi:hypothetical protein